MSIFLITGIQTIALSLACLALWYGWRWFRSAPRPLFLTVTAGLLLRLLVGEILFWISFLELPIGRSLQLGNGLWFFGLDGLWYAYFASNTAAQGLSAILHVKSNLPSPVYLQALSSVMYLIGGPASVSILVNACCYLLGSAILVSLIRRDDRLRTPGLVSLVAVSFAPGSFIWYLQPMKDAFTSLLLIAFIGCLVAWQDIWSQGAGNKWQVARRALATGALMFALLYSIAGVRWYVAMTFWVAFPIFLIALFIVGKHHRFAALGAGLLLAAILGESILLGGADYVVGFRQFVTQGRLTSRMFAWLQQSRTGFESTGGATTIDAGPALLERSTPPPVQARPATQAPPAVAGNAPTAPAQHRPPTEPSPAAASEPDDAASDRPAQETTTVAALDPPKTTPTHRPAANPGPTIEQPMIAVATAKPAPQTTTAAAAATRSVAVAAQSEAPATKPPVMPEKRPVVAGNLAPPKSEVVTSVPQTSAAKNRPEAPQPRKKVQTKSAPAEAAAAVRRVASPVAAVVKPPRPPRSTTATAVPKPPSRFPRSNKQRFLAGLAATFLPRAVAQSFGIISVGGGRGFWLLVEADTIVFDAMLLFVAITSVRLLRRAQSLSPALLALAVSFGILTVGLVYTVSNFGTLFRMRDMLFTELCMLPLLAIAVRDRAPARSPESESLEDDAATGRVPGVEPSL